MASASFQCWHNDRRWPDPKWRIDAYTFDTDYTDFLCTVALPSAGLPYDVEVDGEMKPVQEIVLVGKAATPAGSSASYTHTWVAGRTESEGLIVSFTTTPSSPRNGYLMFYGSTGSESGLYSEPDYTFSSYADFYDAIDNDEITPGGRKEIWYDVYLNGTQDPSIFVNWTCSDNMNISALKPRVWTECEAVSMTDHEFAYTVSGYRYPNDTQWFLDSAGEYTYAGSYRDSFLAIAQHYDSKQNAAEKVLNWGFDGMPAFVGLFLRMDIISYDEHGIAMTEWTQLQRIRINRDATYELASYDDSDMFPNIKVHVRFHSGEPDYIPPDDDPGYPGGTNIDDDGPGRYDPDDVPDPSDFTDPIGYDGNAVLTKTYAVSESTLQNIGQKLWSQSYFNVLKIQNNPIENIVSVKAFPFAMSGTPENIQVGDISFGINGDKVASVQKKKITGSYTYAGKFNNYLDLAPYTSIKINLPYIGLIQLDPADLLGSKLYVEYVIDLVTGQCMAKLYLDEDATTQKAIPYMNLYGQMGVDVPLTSSDRVQTELRAASAAVTAMGSSVGQMVSGNVGGGVVSGISDALSIAGADYTTQRTASQSPACTSHASPDIFILIERPAADEATGVDEYGNVDQNARLGYAHLHGFPCHKFKTLGSYPSNSFVQVERRTDIQIAMTAEENRMLEELLTSGVYV